MLHKKKLVFLPVILGLAILPISAYLIYSESFYWDKAYFMPPIAYTGGIPVRNDHYGEGEFGAKRRGGRRHKGIDITAGVGEPVMAAKGGIAEAKEQKQGMGKYVVIRHKKGLSTLYGHLSEINIKAVQRVRQGDIIGLVGKTGNANYNDMRAHLHFEVRLDGEAVNPRNFLDAGNNDE
ncbi:MAG: M23 family metallopeptidase [Candidatus Omnitrophota bacterium]